MGTLLLTVIHNNAVVVLAIAENRQGFVMSGRGPSPTEDTGCTRLPSTRISLGQPPQIQKKAQQVVALQVRFLTLWMRMEVLRNTWRLNYKERAVLRPPSFLCPRTRVQHASPRSLGTSPTKRRTATMQRFPLVLLCPKCPCLERGYLITGGCRGCWDRWPQTLWVELS